MPEARLGNGFESGQDGFARGFIGFAPDVASGQVDSTPHDGSRGFARRRDDGRHASTMSRGRERPATPIHARLRQRQTTGALSQLRIGIGWHG